MNSEIKPTILASELYLGSIASFGVNKPEQGGIGADFTFNESTGEVDFLYTSTSEYQGMPGYMHGGLISLLLDEAQSSACSHLGFIVMTHRLKVKYFKAIPITSTIRIRASIIKIGTKRVFTEAFITSDDNSILYSKSKGSWYVLSEKMLNRLIKPGSSDYDTMNRLFKIMDINKKQRSHHIKKHINEGGD